MKIDYKKLNTLQLNQGC